MNLKFRVIWIEDMYSEQERELIADGIRQSGFEPEFEIDKDGSKIEELSRQQHLFYDFDFVLLDLNLASSIKGNDLAPKIRHLFRSTPILFYSSVPAEALRRLMLDKNVEGVFCSHRADMPGRVAEMVSDLSMSLNRLAGMRGLAARVVAECDDELRCIIKEACARDGGIEKLCGEIDVMVQQTAKIAQGRYSACTSLDDRLASRAVTSFHLWKLVQRITKTKKVIPNMAEMRVILNSFNDSVLEPRNSLSHVIEQRNDQGWQLVSSGHTSSMTVQNFPDLRRGFVTHLENIRAIRERLASQQT